MHQKILSIIIISSAAALPCLGPTAFGQAATAPQSDELVILSSMEVTARKIATDSTFGTRVNTPLIKTPQSMSVITRAELDARGAQNLNDAVSYTSGVRPESGGMDSRVEQLTIRGYSVTGFGGGGNSNIYLDGLRSMSGGQWTGIQFDVFGLERAEVLKGPSAVLYGQVGPGGIVNAVSKRPSPGNLHSVGVQYGSYNTIQGTFDVSGGNDADPVWFRIAGLVRKGDTEIDYTDDLKRVFVAPSFTWNITKATSLTLLTQYQKDTGGATFQFLPKTGTLVPGLNGFRLSRSAFLGEPDWNEFDRSQFSAGYQFQHVFNETFTLRQNLRYLYLDTEYKSVVIRGTDANFTTGVVARRAMWGVGESKNLTVDTHLQSKFPTGRLAHTLLAGVDIYRSAWDHTRKMLNPFPGSFSIYNPVYTGITQTQIDTMPVQAYDDSTETQTGFYLQDQAVWGNLNATVGLRHDIYDIDFYGEASGVPSKVDTKPTSTTWRAGLLYAFDNGLSPYISYTTSFDAGPYTTTNPATGAKFKDPTEAQQWEAGLKYKPAGFNALFTASLFQIDEKNKLSYFKDLTDNSVKAYQSGEARTRGFELEARAEVLKGFDVIGAYTYLDAETTKGLTSAGADMAGQRLPGVARHTASLWLSYTFDNTILKGLTIGAGTRYIGDTYDLSNTLLIPSYTLYDAAITYDFGKQFPKLRGLSARLSATNLSDKLYVANGNTPATGVAVAYYGSGRNVALNLNYAW